jgi:hypothetical protein
MTQGEQQFQLSTAVMLQQFDWIHANPEQQFQGPALLHCITPGSLLAPAAAACG